MHPDHFTSHPHASTALHLSKFMCSYSFCPYHYLHLAQPQAPPDLGARVLGATQPRTPGGVGGVAAEDAWISIDAHWSPVIHIYSHAASFNQRLQGMSAYQRKQTLYAGGLLSDCVQNWGPMLFHCWPGFGLQPTDSPMWTPPHQQEKGTGGLIWRLQEERGVH